MRDVYYSHDDANLQTLIAACDAALDWADANARWFDISTAPWSNDEDSEYDYSAPDNGSGIGQIHKVYPYNAKLGGWPPSLHVGDLLYQRIDDFTLKPTHWRPAFNPPLGQLPAPLERLGEVLRKVKGG